MGLSVVCVMSDLAGSLARGTRGLGRPSFDARSRSQLARSSSFSLEGWGKRFEVGTPLRALGENRVLARQGLGG